VGVVASSVGVDRKERSGIFHLLVTVRVNFVNLFQLKPLEAGPKRLRVFHCAKVGFGRKLPGLPRPLVGF
jgi:hypothetical protein